MSTQDFLQEYNKARTVCDQAIKSYAADSYLADYPVNDFILKQTKRALLLPGKRLRPSLAYCLTTFFGKRPLSMTPYISLELLHTFLLMHDDIIDECTLRRGKENILGMAKVEFKTKVEKDAMQHFSDSVAIVGGDTMVMESLQPVLSSSLPDKAKLALVNLFRVALQQTCYGWYIQFLLDYTPVGEVKQKAIMDSMYWVTGMYTFALPIRFALLAAGKPQSSHSAVIDAVARELGILFQVVDDIIGLVGDPEKTGKSASSDIEQGKKTLPLYYAYKHTDAAGKKQLESLVGKKNLSDEEVQIVRSILESSGALVRSRRDIETAYERLKKLLSSSSLFQGKRGEFLLGFAEYIMEREA